MACLCELNLDKQTFIIIITSIIWAMNFRFSFKNINYHMDHGNYYSLKYDPFLILIKNILCIFYLLIYFIERRINQIDKKKNHKIGKSNDPLNLKGFDKILKKEEEDLDTKLYKIQRKIFFGLKVALLIIIIYFSEEIYFIIANNHVLDRTLCSIRNVSALLAILIFSAILFRKKIDKTQIKNYLIYKKHQIFPLIIIFILSMFLLLYNYIIIERFKYIYNINLLFYMICFLLMGVELIIIKYLIDELCINKFLILGIKGLLGTIVFSIINISINEKELYNFFEMLLSYQYDLEIEQFNLTFKSFYVITYIILQYLKIIVVTKFNEIHFLSTVMITDIIFFPFYCIERFVVQRFNISTVDTFFINVFIGMINTILMLIFNEILELNFCELNKYLKKNIIKRVAQENINLYTIEEDDSDNTDSNENSITENNSSRFNSQFSLNEKYI